MNVPVGIKRLVVYSAVCRNSVLELCGSLRFAFNEGRGIAVQKWHLLHDMGAK